MEAKGCILNIDQATNLLSNTTTGSMTINGAAQARVTRNQRNTGKYRHSPYSLQSTAESNHSATTTLYEDNSPGTEAPYQPVSSIYSPTTGTLHVDNRTEQVAHPAYDSAQRSPEIESSVLVSRGRKRQRPFIEDPSQRRKEQGLTSDDLFSSPSSDLNLSSVRRIANAILSADSSPYCLENPERYGHYTGKVTSQQCTILESDMRDPLGTPHSRQSYGSSSSCSGNLTDESGMENDVPVGRGLRSTSPHSFLQSNEPYLRPGVGMPYQSVISAAGMHACLQTDRGDSSTTPPLHSLTSSRLDGSERRHCGQRLDEVEDGKGSGHWYKPNYANYDFRNFILHEETPINPIGHMAQAAPQYPSDIMRHSVIVDANQYHQTLTNGFAH
jgi:hypothetical protein